MNVSIFDITLTAALMAGYDLSVSLLSTLLLCNRGCEGNVFLCSGYANRKGEGSLQHLRRLHCPGGRLLAWKALCCKCRGQQVSRHSEEEEEEETWLK